MKANQLSFFIVIFLCLIMTVLLLAPLVIRLSRENAKLEKFLQSAHHEVAKILSDSENFRTACENTSDGINIQDMRGRIIWSNSAFSRIHGRSPQEVKGRNPEEFAPPPDQRLSAQDLADFRYDTNDPQWSSLQLFENQRADGQRFWIQVSLSFCEATNGRQNAIQICRDVTEQIEHENNLRNMALKLEHEATHDGLTGVPNRSAFVSFFKRALDTPNRPLVGLLHIDLDRFKAINDTHGHAAGDAMLDHTARILQDNIGAGDMVARIGGDEFVVVCPNIANFTQLETLSNNLIDTIREPFEWQNGNLSSEVSIGAVLADPGKNNADDLLVQADFALYEAKHARRNKAVLYDDDLRARHAFQLRRTSELAEAVDTGALDYVFQPKMDLASGAITGVETLVRWNHPQDGMISPDEFLPMAKTLGLMGAVDLLSMTAALAKKRSLNLAGFHNVTVAFNASPELLSHPDFITRLVWGVEASGIKRSQITIEVLETTEFGDPTEATSNAAVLRDLRGAGFMVHLDDFGVGFAGLSHLATLDVSGIKVDRGLVTDLLTDTVSYKIVRKIIELANDLGFSVVAEGIEDEATSDALEHMGCGVIQGYWLSRPLPDDQLLDWLNAHSKQIRKKRA